MYSQSVVLEHGRRVHGQTFDSPSLILIKIYYPLLDYVEGRELPEGMQSAEVQFDFWSGNGRQMIDDKPWPYMDFQINGKQIDVNNIERSAEIDNRFLQILNAIAYRLRNSENFTRRAIADQRLTLDQLYAEIDRFTAPANTSSGVY